MGPFTRKCRSHPYFIRKKPKQRVEKEENIDGKKRASEKSFKVIGANGEEQKGTNTGCI